MSKVEQTRSIHATFDNLNQDADMLCLTGRECQRAHNGSGCLSGSSGPCRRCIGEDLVRYFFSNFPTALRKRHRGHHPNDRRRRLVRREAVGKSEKALKACRRRFFGGIRAAALVPLLHLRRACSNGEGTCFCLSSLFPRIDTHSFAQAFVY
jgi:hypothetical protein